MLTSDLGPCPADGLVLREGAILDCAGHAIQGPGHPTDGAVGSDAVGVVLDRTVGAVVRHCTITAFRTGIELREASRSSLIGNTVMRNGDFRNRAGYGVHFSRSTGNTLLECVVHGSADEGIHVGSDSNDNALISNELYDNGRENIYVLGAAGTQVLRNQTRGKVSANLYVKNSSGSHVEGNTFAERPVVLRGAASDNTFLDNVFGGGLSFRAYPDWAEDAERPTGNVVRGGSISGAAMCIQFIDADGNRMEFMDVSGCKRIVARSQRQTTNSILGSALERIRLDLSGGATLRLLANVRIEVTDRAGGPVRDATLHLRAPTGQATAAPPLNEGGVVDVQFPSHVVNAATLVALMPTTLTVVAAGYAPRDVVLTEPLPERLTVTLDAAP